MSYRFLAGAVMLSVAGWALALDPKGKPDGLEAGKTRRWYVWHNDNGWHLRTTTQSRMHEFHGKITVTGGRIRDVSVTQGDKKVEKNDRWKLSDNNRELTLNFKTDGGMDGFDFQVGGKADEIQFILKIDGEEKPEWIFVGKNEEHPEKSTFTLPAFPK